MRIRCCILAAVTLLAVGVVPARAESPAYTAPTCVLTAPGATPSQCTWQGIVLQSPPNEEDIATPDLSVACNPTTLAECEDTKVTVPAGVSPSTLYVKVSWHHPVWSAFLYLIDPNGVLHGGGALGCDESSYEKGCGNQTTLPFDELVVADPIPGTWTVRVAAVNFHDENYVGTLSLTHSHPLEYARESLAELASHLTRHEPVNVVFAGWTPTADELAELRAGLTSEFVPAVAEKAFCDGFSSDDTGAGGLVQHQTTHCTATAAPDDPNYFSDGTVPYFEPVRFLFDYHFLTADDLWTKDLFATMQQATTLDHTLSDSRVPGTAESAGFKAAYLAAYNAANGGNRGAKAVSDTSTVDEIDGLTVENWIHDHRFDAKYARSFTDLDTGKRRGPSFINPDPAATRDPFWDSNGTTAPNLDRDPQGANTGITFFLLDTFSPSYADQYFRPDHYHYWWTADHVIDPDFGEPGFADNGRGWGGQYRFHIMDLGAAPSTYERANWLTASAAVDGGSAAFDPPIWDFRNSPEWDGSSPPGPLQAGGNTLGAVMGWEITQGIAFKYAGSYLYRPIPNDVYVLATSSLVDHYSLPSEGDLYAVDMTKVADLDFAVNALSSAAPYANFQRGPDQTRVLGCAPSRAVIIGNPTQIGELTNGLVTQVPDVRCNGLTEGEQPDDFQQAIEDGKANGSGSLVVIDGQTFPTFAVNQHYIRNYVDHHRAEYAPLYDGAFTVPVVNIMFEHAYTVALPLVVGGIAENVNGGEGWGQIDNVNDQYVMKDAIDCANSSPVAPGCNGIPDVFRHDVGLTYTMVHESAHFLGLPHPHDGSTSVATSTDGRWHYYYEMLKWLYDISASPTTYAGTYTTYEAIDQERLMVGHAGEYLRQAQDGLSDRYFQDGASGLTAPSRTTSRLVKQVAADIAQASKLFQVGDYLHAMYGMRNASLHARGIIGAPVAPHRLTMDEAATGTNAIFTINPQQVYAKPVLPGPSDPPMWVGPGDGAAARLSGRSPAGGGEVRASFCHIHYQ